MKKGTTSEGTAGSRKIRQNAKIFSTQYWTFLWNKPETLVFLSQLISIYINIPCDYHLYKDFLIFYGGGLKLTLWKVLLHLTMLNHSYFINSFKSYYKVATLLLLYSVSLALSSPFPGSSRIHFLFGLPETLLLWGLYCFALLPPIIYCWAATCLLCLCIFYRVRYTKFVIYRFRKLMQLN